MLVVNFMPPSAPSSASYFVELLKQPRGLSKKIQVLDRVHSTLKDISHVVPLSPLRLEKIVRDRMPNIYTKEPVRSNSRIPYVLLSIINCVFILGLSRVLSILSFSVYISFFNKMNYQRMGMIRQVSNYKSTNVLSLIYFATTPSPLLKVCLFHSSGFSAP